MTPEYLLLIKLFLAHLITDFVAQPRSWVAARKQQHFASPQLYLHGLVTGAGAFLAMGTRWWIPCAVIMITHVLIDGWKSYQRESLAYFVLDQCLHLAVLVGCWYYIAAGAMSWDFMRQRWTLLPDAWVILTAVVLLTTPAGILIGQLTQSWRQRIGGAESLANAGKWIGIVERLMVLILVLVHEYSAISLLIAAKGIIRFNEKDRPEVKTEYLVIGTLISIGLALAIGVGALYLTGRLT